MSTRSLFLLAAPMLAGVCFGWDPLYYNGLTRVLRSTESSSDFAIGYFSSGSYWETDTLGFDSLYEYREQQTFLQAAWTGRYGLTSSHTISLVVPLYLQLAGSEEARAGITDPWISLDGWMSRNPQYLIRGAFRPAFKGYLESADPPRSDPHMAAEAAATFELPLARAGGTRFDVTGGLRYYFKAWDRIPGTRRDSSETSPGAELIGCGFLVAPVNPELSLRIGGEFAARGRTSYRSEAGDVSVPGSNRSRFDFRGGFSLINPQMKFNADVYIRLAGENVDKEWGIILSGIGINLGDIFGVGSGGRSGER